MGNRAVITASKSFSIKDSNDLGVYMHWNGGRDSVEAFLDYCKFQGFRSPESDSYGYARLVQVIANFFGSGGLSVSVDKCCSLDCENWDNGVYVIENWEIVDRKYFDGDEQDLYDRTEMLLEIDGCQPKDMQLGEKFIKAPVVKTETLKVGDRVFVQSYTGGYEIQEVVGFGEDGFVNGTNVYGIPYVDNYLNNGVYSSNINNYLRLSEYRVSHFAKK
jgi:hypothetical protein